MPTLQDEQIQRQALRTALAEIDLLKPDDLRRADLPSELNFDDGLPFFERTWRLFRDLATFDLDLASYSLLSRLNQVAQQTVGQFRQIQSFKPEAFGAPQNARNQRDALITQVRDFYENVFDQVVPARAYLGRPSTDSTHLAEDVRRIVSRADALAVEGQATLTAKLATADRILEGLRTSAATVGIAQFAGRFEAEAKSYKTVARGWLIATIALAIATIGFGAWSFRYTLDHVGTWTTLVAVQLTVSKLIIFSVLASGLVWCGHIYRVNRHNFVLNRHRQTALDTFKVLSEATDDPQARSAILLQTSWAIFGHQATGFTEGELEVKGLSSVTELLGPASSGQ